MGVSILINGQEIECQEELTLTIPNREPIVEIKFEGSGITIEQIEDIKAVEGFFDIEIHGNHFDALFDDDRLLIYLKQ